MVTNEMIQDAKEFLGKAWGDKSKAVIDECGKFPLLDMTCEEFLNNCIVCGGNWGGMLLTGIRKLRPSVWEVIPDDMGICAWACLCNILILCGVDTRE